MIVITGGSDGLGKELINLFKASGKTVVNVSRTKNDQADYNFLHNLRESQAIKQAVQSIEEIDEPLEVLINNAGVFSKQPLGKITEDEIKRTMESNLNSQIMLTSELIDTIKRDETDIVNISSRIGFVGSIDLAVYGASKWAVRGFSESLQAEFKDLANRVISFCPGGFDTGLFVKATNHDPTKDGTDWMKPRDLALLIKQLLDLPKNIEVSEILINRKKK
ncbi:SDR family NAD(P)-dependent oxidoreductase [Candidatus Saccharibacteria bacterium]|jgi:short-subunit dehydrogenase|nr:SDR family NAD(P)-dependent oxidoreductase [Candidatus Saccharibacteria bacterium]